MKKFINKLISILLSIIILLMFTNIAVNQHSHLINGMVITHAHPYNADKNTHSPFQSHKHTSSVLFILDQLTNVITLLIIILCLSAFIKRRIFSVVIHYISNFPDKDFLFFRNFRAPPACL